MPFDGPIGKHKTGGAQGGAAGAGGRHREMMMATLDSLGEDLGALMLKHKSALHSAPHEPEQHNSEHPMHAPGHSMHKTPGPAQAGSKPPTEEFKADQDEAGEDPESRLTEESEVPGQEAKDAEMAGINRMLSALGSAGAKPKKSHRY